MVVSVVVGFWNISISRCGVFLMIARSRKLTLLFRSGVRQSYTRLRKTTKTNEHIVPHTINMPEFNTAYCYSTIPHTAITPLSRQLLMMGMELPETC